MHAAPSQSKLVGTTLEAQKIHKACAVREVLQERLVGTQQWGLGGARRWGEV